MAWIDIGAADQLADNSMRPLAINGKQLLLCRSGQRHFVVDEMCSHEDYSLSLGCVRDGRIKCSLHGSWFDLDSGAALEEPACEAIASYPVQQQGNRLLIELPD